MILILDNYESFTYNIAARLDELSDEPVTVIRSDAVTLEEIEKLAPSRIIISPGPGRPEDAGISMEAVRRFAGKIPILGICLGHQVIAQVYGAKIIGAAHIKHGKLDLLEHDGRGLFRNISRPARIVRYHSLAVDAAGLSDQVEITARSADGEIMGIRHTSALVEGLQFHPESIATEEGTKMLKNFLSYRREAFDMRFYLQRVMDGSDLSRSEAAAVMDELTNGDLPEAQIAGFLTALNIKGFTSEEIAGCAQVLREKRVRLPYSGALLDTCGTGGDGLGTFNISSMAALVCAAAGAEVAKHGNRAVSSLSGSADFYRALGIHIDLSPAEAVQLLEQTSFTFMFAPYYHSAMRHAAAARRGLGMKTIMNVLGPLANPADSDFQLLGVYDVRLLPIVARAAKALGVRRILTVHGDDGEDEISSSGPTELFFIDEEGTEERLRIRPEDFGFASCSEDPTRGRSAEENARTALELSDTPLKVLLAPGHPCRSLIISVLLNSGAALYTAGICPTIGEGVKRAEEVFTTRAVRSKIDQVVTLSQRFAEAG